MKLYASTGKSATSNKSNNAITIIEKVTVQAPREKVYAFWKLAKFSLSPAKQSGQRNC
jgi:uncharacterized membrane protein